MTLEQAAKILSDMYQSAPKGEQVAHIHLFGIKYAQDIDGMNTKEIASLAGIQESYGTEIRKGVKLARYVEPK